MNLTAHPLFRPLLAIFTFLFAMQALRATWGGKSRAQIPLRESHQDRLVVAHFMVQPEIIDSKLLANGSWGTRTRLLRTTG